MSFFYYRVDSILEIDLEAKAKFRSNITTIKSTTKITNAKDTEGEISIFSYVSMLHC